VDEKTRQQITWTIISALVVSLIILAFHRRAEVDNLINTVATGNLAQRIEAVETLIAKQKLAESLEDRPRWVQTNAIQAATMVGSEEALFQLIGTKVYLDTPVAAAVDSYLISMGETAIGPLVQAMQDKDAGVRGGSGGPLKAIGASAVDSLMPLIDVYDDAVRGLVASTLAGIGEPSVVPLMRIMKQMKPLPDQEPAAFRRAKSAAQAAFTGMLATAFGPITEQVLTDPNPEVRSTGAQILGTITNQTKIGAMVAEDASAVVAPLVSLITTDPVWTVRRRAAASLGLLTDVAAENGAVAPLIAQLGHERPEVRAAVAKALGEIRAPEAAGPLAVTLMSNRTGATNELAIAMEKIGAPAIGPLTPALGHAEPEVRLVATQTIATIGTGAAVLPLGRALGDSDVKVRRAAADALRTLATAEVLPQLATALSDEDWQVYYAARDALARVGQPAVPTLVKALGNPDTRVAYMAEQAIASIGKPAIGALIANLTTADENVIEWSAIALGDIGHDAVQAAASILVDTGAATPARVAAARALGLTKAKAATQPLIGAASSADAAVREAAVKALNDVGDAEATEVLALALTDDSPDVREAAMQILRNWRMGNIDEQLSEITKSDDANGARRAAVVMAQHRSAAGGGLMASLGTQAAAEQIGGASADQIRTLLQDAAGDEAETINVREASIVALGFVGTEASLDALAPLLEAGGVYAVDSAKAVGHIGERMAEAMEDGPDQEVSRPAKLLLDMFASAETDDVRMVAATGLSLMGAQPVPSLVEMMEKADPEIRPWIAAVLGAIGKPATNKVLDARPLAQDTEVRAWLAATLKLIGDARALDLLDNLPKEEQPSEDKVEDGREIFTRLVKQVQG